MWRKILLLLIVTGTPVAWAVSHVTVLGLFRNKAVVMVDGHQRSLSVGATSPEGVTLISASSDAAVLEIAGKRATYALGSQVGGDLTSTLPVMQIYPNPQGMYATSGSINGQPVNFLLDTGATLVAMNADEATRLGIDYRHAGLPAAVTTASGVEQAYQIVVNSIRLGDIELHDVGAVVLESNTLQEVLLGMSFLARLDIANRGQALQLRRKY